MSWANYRAIRKANKKDRTVPNYVPYDQLAKYISSINIGNIHDVEERYGCNSDEEKIHGVCRSLSEFALRLVQFYLTVNENRKDKLLSFDGSKENSKLFMMIICGDSVPGTLNAAYRLASSSENFLVFGANTSENSYVSRKFVLELVSDIKYLENNVFKVYAVNQTLILSSNWQSSQMT